MTQLERKAVEESIDLLKKFNGVDFYYIVDKALDSYNNNQGESKKIPTIIKNSIAKDCLSSFSNILNNKEKAVSWLEILTKAKD